MTTENDRNSFLKKHMTHILGFILLFAIATAAVVIFFYATTFNGVITATHERWGTFGDFFGGVLSPIFSFLALLALLLTIILQNKELTLATIEFTKSNIALEKQSKSLEIQNFKHTFFQLLNTHNQIVNSIDLRKNGMVTTSGRDCFTIFYKRFKEIYIIHKSSKSSSEPIFVKNLYIKFYNSIQQDTGHYFLFLYNMVKFVKENCKHEDPKFYTNIIRAQLSYDELALLFYNCHSVIENNKFKPLIEKFGLFKNLPEDRLINSDKHITDDFYNKSAWQKT